MDLTYEELKLLNNRTSESNNLVHGKNRLNNNNEVIRLLAEQNKLLMQLLQKEVRAEIAFESVYQPIKKRLSQEQYSHYKQGRR